MANAPGRDFENFSYGRPGRPGLFNLGVVFKTQGVAVTLGTESTFKHTREFGFNGDGDGNLVVVSATQTNQQFAVGTGHIVDNRGRVTRLPEEYVVPLTPDEQKYRRYPRISLPAVVIGEPWEVAGTETNEAGPIDSVWVLRTDKISVDPREADRVEPSVPAFALYNHLLVVAMHDSPDFQG